MGRGHDRDPSMETMMELDPVGTNPDLYRVVFENDRVRVLRYHDDPGDRTRPHTHPDSVMVTLSSFHRRLYGTGEERDVEIDADTVAWLPAQEHAGYNIGQTPTDVIFIELKETTAQQPTTPAVGPAGP